MPVSVSGVCDVCYASFALAYEEVRMLPTMMGFDRPLREGQEPRTWVDWVRHVSSHCKAHRLPSPPISCLEDFARHLAMRNADGP